MKYVRTKDGIISTKGLRFCHCSKQPNHYKDSKNLMIYVPIKEADTIEELCDEFVVAYEDGTRAVYCDLEWAKSKAKISLELGIKSIIYGAIWTDQGLIYVAKLDDKGGWVLL